MQFSDIIGDVLEKSPDSVYRRLRGDKELTLSELVKLCLHFNVSVDDIVNYKSHNVHFKYSRMDFGEPYIYEKYMEEMKNVFGRVAMSAKKELLSTAMDIPIFHLVNFPELMFLKIYSWHFDLCNVTVSFEQFISKLDKEKLIAYYKAIVDSYKQIPSIELWMNSTIDNLLQLINYYHSMHCFENMDYPNLLCNQLLQLIDSIEQLTAKENKEYRGKKTSFKFFLSTADLQNNYIHFKGDNITFTAIKIFTVNGIFTHNEEFCEETEKWIKNIITKSILISGAAAVERFNFFKTTKTKINNQIENFHK
jgi:hypothetical protein